MRVYRKAKGLLSWLFVLILVCPLVTFGRDRLVKINKVELQRTLGRLKLRAELNFQLSTSAEEALHSGIILYWNVPVVLKQSRWGGLWHETLLHHAHRYSLSYHTLVNNYRVTDEQTHFFRRFASLKGALKHMSRVEYRELSVAGASSEQCILTVFNVIFDKEALPSPLRPFAYFDRAWDLSAQEWQQCE